MSLCCCWHQFILIGFPHERILPLAVHIFSILKNNYRSTRRAVFNLTVHIVLVTKYRRKVIDGEMIEELASVFQSVLASWDSQLIEFNCEADHAHLLVSYPPHKLLSSLIANLKATSSKTMWRKFEPKLKEIYWRKRVFWTGAISFQLRRGYYRCLEKICSRTKFSTPRPWPKFIPSLKVRVFFWKKDKIN